MTLETPDTGQTGETDPLKDDFYGEGEPVVDADPDEGETKEVSEADPDKKGESDKEQTEDAEEKEEKPEKLWGGKYKTADELEEAHNRTVGELTRIAGERNTERTARERVEGLLKLQQDYLNPGDGKKVETEEQKQTRIDDFNRKLLEDPETAILEVLKAAGDSEEVTNLRKEVATLKGERQEDKFKNRFTDLVAKHPEHFQDTELLGAIQKRYEANPKLIEPEDGFERLFYEELGRRGTGTPDKPAKPQKPTPEEESKTLTTGKAGKGKSETTKKTREEQIGDDIVNANPANFSSFAL